MKNKLNILKTCKIPVKTKKNFWSNTALVQNVFFKFLNPKN